MQGIYSQQQFEKLKNQLIVYIREKSFQDKKNVLFLAKNY